MIHNSSDTSRFVNVNPPTGSAFTATLVSYDPSTGLADLRLQAQTAGIIQVRVSPLLRAAAANFLVPGVVVGVMAYPGRPPYVVDVFDGEGAPATGGITDPRTGNPFGLGPSGYTIPSSRID